VGTVSVLADISAVLVVLEFMVLAAIPLAVLYFANKGMRWLNEHLRLWLRQVQAGVNKLRDAINQSSQSVVKPFVTASVYAAQAGGFFRSLGRILGSKSSGKL